jgi:Protein of unknown function (DUF3025)
VRYDPSFFRKSALFWPVARAAGALEGEGDWPGPAFLSRLLDRKLSGDLGAAPLGELPTIRFARAAPRARRGRALPEERYDARIALERVVPTRERSWHDLLNALVWTTFPLAKLALHQRQHRIIEARLGSDLRLPRARTKEQDALAMFDEGGAVWLCERGHGHHLAAAMAHGADASSLVERGAALVAVFGHAIYEGLACGGPEEVRAATYVVEVDSVRDEVLGGLVAADRALATFLSREAPISREDFETLRIGKQLEVATERAARKVSDSWAL